MARQRSRPFAGLVLSSPEMTEPDPDADARRELRRHRAFATFLLLLLMGAITLGCYALPDGWWTDLLQAAAKAGFVGGIADWFAVTALFRHPLGIPIPHTAIIPRQKERLGLALGRFVANHVITADEVSVLLGRLDVPGILSRYLSDPVSARPAAIALATLLPRILATVEDGRARRVAGRIIPRVPSAGCRGRGGRGAGAAHIGRGRPPSGGVWLRSAPNENRAQRAGGDVARGDPRSVSVSRGGG